MKIISRILLASICMCALLGGCKDTEIHDTSKKLSYEYPPPIENLSWGMSEEDVLKKFNLQNEDVTWKEYEVDNIFEAGGKSTVRYFYLKDTIKFLDEESNAICYFYDKIGLSRIAIVFLDRSEHNIEVDVPLKLKEKYESTWGTLVNELDESSQQKLKEYLRENKMPEDVIEYIFEGRRRAVVTYELNLNKNTQGYGSVLFTGYLASMLEHAL